VLYVYPGFDGEPSFRYDNGNENYYLVASIGRVADRLILSGEIKPMIIVLPDASIWYGGAFYANSALAGQWEDIMAKELIDYIDDPDTVRFRSIPRKESRALSGHSSGGYGAMRVVIKYPDQYNSVSCIDAPLAFDSLATLFDDYLSESGIPVGDLDAFNNTDSTGLRSQPYKLMFYSMAATFTPRLQTGTTPLSKLLIALPFDQSANPVDSIWNIWLDNDLYSWLDNSVYADALNGQNIYMEWSDLDLYGFSGQTKAFFNRLGAVTNANTSWATFSSYDGYDARSRSFLYERLEEILKFHDRYLMDRYGNY
jgi:pimeloyl-ACP methyl ester carboxylesterase